MSSDAVEGHGPVRNTAYATATLVTSALFTAGLTLFLIRYLGPDDYGVFSVAVSVGAIVALPADLGISASTARFIAENLGSRAKVAEILLGGLRLRLLSGLVGSVLLFALAGTIADAYDTPSLTTPIQLTAIAVFAQGLGAFLQVAMEGLRIVKFNFQYAMLESSTEALSTLVLVLLGAGAAGAAGGRAIGFGFGLVLITILVVKLLGRKRLREAVSGHREHVRRIARYGVALLVIDGAITLFNRMDVLIIGAYKGTAAAGIFEAAMRLVTFLQYGGLALTPGFAPRLTRAEGPEGDADRRAFWKAFQVILLLQLLLLAGMVVWAEPITQAAFGSEFEGSAEVFRALGPYMLLAGLAPLVTIGVNYLGEARRRVPLAIAAVLLNLVFDLIFVPKWGAVAAAVGSALAFALYVPGHLLICRAEVGMPGRALAVTALRGSLASIAAAALLFALGTEHLSALDWVLGAIGAPAIFVAVLLATGEVTIAQIRAGSGAARARWKNR